MRSVALATCAALPEGWPDDHLLAAALREQGADVGFCVWDDPEVDWGRFDAVVIRSTWDYTERREQFVSWGRRVGERLRNRPDLVVWNSDKRYLADLEDAGLPIVPTRFVEPGTEPPPLDGEVVIKPVVSAGARDTGRFGPSARGEAEALLRRLAAEGRTAMVQPYLAAVDTTGETAIAYFGGVESHVLRKLAVLAPDQEAPVRDEGVSAAEAMFDKELVGAGEAGAEERELAAGILHWVGERFGSPPLYARVDMVRDEQGKPVLLELEAVEPSFYLATVAGSAARFAAAVLDERRLLG